MCVRGNGSTNGRGGGGACDSDNSSTIGGGGGGACDSGNNSTIGGGGGRACDSGTHMSLIHISEPSNRLWTLLSYSSSNKITLVSSLLPSSS